MKQFILDRSPRVTDFRTLVAGVLALALVLWSTGLPSWLPFVQAAALTDISDTLSDSDLSATSDHAWAFTTITALDANDTIVFTLDPTSSLFTIGALGVSDVTGMSGLTVVSACGVGGDELTLATTTTTITLTVCATDTVTAGAKTLTFDNLKITNPGVQASYIMRVKTTNDGGATRDTSDTRVAIVNDVVVTASVDTIFNFTVAGVAANTAINGDTATTSTTTSAIAIGFETLYPGIAEVGAQTLSVETNAQNGFSVTVVQDQELTSATGATINNFIDGLDTSTPTAWQSPAGTLGSFDTYGHFGVTSEDANFVGGADTFGTALYVGDLGTPRLIFYHNGPADGSTASIGTTRVGYKIEIDSLQEAGTDYTSTLTYVATPVF
jgi:hypothetical protein